MLILRDHVFTHMGLLHVVYLQKLEALKVLMWVGGEVNQAYSRLSTTHGHITDWKLDSVVYAGVCEMI